MNVYVNVCTNMYYLDPHFDGCMDLASHLLSAYEPSCLHTNISTIACIHEHFANPSLALFRHMYVYAYLYVW